ncbi:MAG: MBOAT family O-acyltransferase [Cellvibrionaceae bacterium]
MIFSSNVFLFLFLPTFLAIYYCVAVRHRSLVILLGSYAFYAWWRLDFLLLFIAVTLWNYVIGLRIADSLNQTAIAKRWCTLGVVVNLSVLGYFKYANFGAEAVSLFMTEMGMDPWLMTHVILPIGISFYIFQAISYLIDVLRKDTPANRNLVDFSAFIALFPQLIAGPVLRYKDVAGQFIEREHSLDKFSQGVQRFMIGFIKKIVIADTLAPMVDAGFAIEDPSTADAALAILAYSAQLYFDFSGYADMAIGLGLMIGFRFVENFNHPYASQSITEFWRRWHISLSSWLRDYLYIPLGGNRSGHNYRNLMLTMVLGGFWHGANWTFLIWGLWHGLILSAEKALGVDTSGKGFSLSKWLLTLILVMLGWVVFRAETLASAITIYQALAGIFTPLNSFQEGQFFLSQAYAIQVLNSQIACLTLAWIIIVFRAFLPRINASIFQSSWTKPMVLCGVLPLFAFAVMKLSAQSYTAFLYFQF